MDCSNIKVLELIKKNKLMKRISFLSLIFFLFFISSCGIKKSWEESGRYTADKELESTYIWKKGKQYIAIVQTIPVRGRNKQNTIHPINISEETIYNSFSKIQYVVADKKGR